MSRNRILKSCYLALVALIWLPVANADLYLLLNVGDSEDIEAGSAAETLVLAQNGNRPAKINGQAPRYFVHVPGATTSVISGGARPVDAAPQRDAVAVDSISESVASTASETASDAGMAVAAANVDTGDTGWVEYEAGAASLMLFSPDGLDEESEIRYEPARVFVRRFDDGDVYVMITGKDGRAPR